MNAIKNFGASVRARLLNRARADKVDFNLMLTRYVLDRLQLTRETHRNRTITPSRRIKSKTQASLSAGLFHDLTKRHVNW
jgi:hypothetical protein